MSSVGIGWYSFHLFPPLTMFSSPTTGTVWWAIIIWGRAATIWTTATVATAITGRTATWATTARVWGRVFSLGRFFIWIIISFIITIIRIFLIRWIFTLFIFLCLLFQLFIQHGHPWWSVEVFSFPCAFICPVSFFKALLTHYVFFVFILLCI